MSAPQEILAHGTITTPVLMDERVRTSLRDLDEVDQDYMTAGYGTFVKGAINPRYPAMRIQQVDERLVPGGVIANLRSSGLLTGISKRIALSWKEDAFGFDVASEERIVVQDSTFTWAAALTGYANMLLVGPVGETYNLDNRWSRRTFEYRGIKKAGLVSRKVTVNENQVQPGDAVSVSLTNPTLSGTFRVQASFPRIAVTETIKSTSAPDMTAVPGAVATPISGIAFPAVRVISITGDVVQNWPYGWKIASIDPEYLHAGSSINVATYTYEYVPESQF